MTKEKLKSNIVKIYSMSLYEINNYRTAVSVSQAEDRAKDFMYRACDNREAELRERGSAIVENGEISEIS